LGLPRYFNENEEILLKNYRCFPEKYIIIQYELQPSLEFIKKHFPNIEYDATIHFGDSFFEELQATLGKDITERRLKLPTWIRVYSIQPFRYKVSRFRLDDYGLRV